MNQSKHDLEQEQRIERYCWQAAHARALRTKKRYWQRMREAIRMRSPQQVARMEAKLGLREV